jgi:hypothetical protein
MKEVGMATLAYQGWPNCYKMSNGEIELIVTTDVGPRIIHCGFVGGDNIFKVFDEHAGKTGGGEHRIYGGHRLWHSPEVFPRTYQPDNSAVTLEVQGDLAIRLVQPVEETTGIQKEIDVQMDARKAHVHLVHRLRNTSQWPVELACWAISIMGQPGKAIIPLPPRRPQASDNLLPVNILTMWAYTNMADPRWTWGNEYIMLEQDPAIAAAQKVGVMDAAGWAAYACKAGLFVKVVAYVPGATYPDWGCNVETYTSGAMLELETLGPLAQLRPDASIEHIEDWYLFKDIPVPVKDADINAHVLPKVQSILPA